MQRLLPVQQIVLHFVGSYPHREHSAVTSLTLGFDEVARWLSGVQAHSGRQQLESPPCLGDLSLSELEHSVRLLHAIPSPGSRNPAIAIDSCLPMRRTSLGLSSRRRPGPS